MKHLVDLGFMANLLIENSHIRRPDSETDSEGERDGAEFNVGYQAPPASLSLNKSLKRLL